MTSSNVPVGIASKVGYLLTLLGGGGVAWAASSSHPAISPSTLLIVTIVAGIATNFGRQLQGKEAIRQEGFAAIAAGSTPELPTDAEEAEAQPPDEPETVPVQPRPETAVVPDAASPVAAPAPAAPVAGA